MASKSVRVIRAFGWSACHKMNWSEVMLMDNLSSCGPSIEQVLIRPKIVVSDTWRLSER